MKKRILLMSEVLTMAHLFRPAALAKELQAQGYEVHFASTNIPQWLKDTLKEVQVWDLGSDISSEDFIKAIGKGQTPFTENNIEKSVAWDIELIDRVKPALVIGDMRLSLKISCQLMKVPYVNLSNSTWDSTADQEVSLPELPVVKWLGVSIPKFFFKKFKKNIYKKLAAPFNKTAQKFGVEEYGSYEDVLTSGDYVAYLDMTGLVDFESSPRKWAIGALPHHNIFQEPKPNLYPEKSLPRIFVTMGSSGNTNSLAPILKGLAELPVEVIVVTNNKTLQNPDPKRFFFYGFVNLDKVLPTCDLVINNGGSSGCYPTLSYGLPLITVPSNLDQHQHSAAIQKFGVSTNIRSDELSKEKICQATWDMLKSHEVKLATANMAQKLRSENPLNNFLVRIDRLLDQRSTSNTLEKQQ